MMISKIWRYIKNIPGAMIVGGIGGFYCGYLEYKKEQLEERTLKQYLEEFERKADKYR